MSRASRATTRITGAPMVTATSSGANATALPTSALSRTGISSTMPRSRSRRQRGHLERDVGAERGASDHGLVELEVVEEGDDVAGELAHRVAPHVARPGRRPLAERVQQDDLVPALGEVLGERGVHPRRQQQAGSSTTGRSPDPWTV